MKRCARCRVLKSRDSFRASRKLPDGLQPYCKPCQVEANREWAKANTDTERERRRRWKRENRDKHLAHHAVRKAVRSGRLIRPSACSQCARAGEVHAHHEDYTRRLEVVWLCPTCHAAQHQKAEAA